eukprot:TRINITY_DN539_c0_g1_i1.p1 TRINITY_DN539_c0_g1~~TRINITY_DN539_c0_g1_i1.p1  ORF type:complete len:143 (-),score=43.10 TRINITY_DN539_c0_g1_i1:157-585(-)
MCIRDRYQRRVHGQQQQQPPQHLYGERKVDGGDGRVVIPQAPVAGAAVAMQQAPMNTQMPKLHHILNGATKIQTNPTLLPGFTIANGNPQYQQGITPTFTQQQQQAVQHSPTIYGMPKPLQSNHSAFTNSPSGYTLQGRVYR